MKLLLTILFTSCISLAEIVVVTNENSTIDTLPKELIQYLYLAKVTQIENIKILPLLSKDNKLHKEFVNTILNKTLSQYNSYWARLVFTGRKSISKKLDNKHIEEQLQYLNTIAYVEKSKVKKGWKIVFE